MNQLARSSDPWTSHAAAQQALCFAENHRERIVQALQEHGPMGKDAIARVCNMDGVAVARRLPELAREGRVCPTGEVVPSATGRNERQWRAV